MEAENKFIAMLGRINGGDQNAVREFVHEYGRAIFRYIRHRMASSLIHRVVEAEDILQSVLAHFFACAKSTPKTWETAKEMIGFICVMARNKIRDYERHLAPGIAREKLCPSEGFEEALLHAFQRKRTAPGDALEQSEQVEKVHQQMTNKEWKLTTERMSGGTWQEIASPGPAHFNLCPQ